MEPNMAKVFTPYIHLRNGKILWANQVGLTVFCFEGDSDYRRKTKKSAKIDDSSVKIEDPIV